ncbi:MAG: hypothetical protein U9Q34_06125, partial [Elusimicrobiota bacterium]|nr:hypothetical protein [Elusimicrobiota bacterium]
FIGSQGAYGIILNATLKLDSKNHFRDFKIKEATFEDNPDFFNHVPGKYAARLKEVFDPQNLFNPQLYEKKNTGKAFTGENVSSLKDYSMDKIHKQNDLFKLSKGEK